MKTKRNQPSNNKFKDILKMGYQAASKEVRSSYPDLHITTLIGSSNPLFHRITLQGY
jgi:hypothetical protein